IRTAQFDMALAVPPGPPPAKSKEANAIAEAPRGDSLPAPKPKSEDPRSPVQRADYESRAFNAQPPALRPAADEELNMLPAGSPFEAVQQSGVVKLRVRRSILLRTKVDIYRTAIVDETVCDIVQFTPREVSIIGRAVGQTHVTFWFDDPAMA